MVGAVKNGEIDAISEVPTSLFPSLAKTKGMTTVKADDGSFNMLTINTGSGPVGNGHPALADKKVGSPSRTRSTSRPWSTRC